MTDSINSPLPLSQRSSFSKKVRKSAIKLPNLGESKDQESEPDINENDSKKLKMRKSFSEMRDDDFDSDSIQNHYSSGEEDSLININSDSRNQDKKSIQEKIA